MKKKRKAFTLAEALILLLIAALLAAALVPVITRKHREVGEHGEWVCTMNSDGKHVIKTTYRGKVSKFEVANGGGANCVFSPPANAKDFTIKAVGGGGGGGGGTKGGVETLFDSRESGTNYAGVIESDGNYNIIYAGGGGGGGGMACGEAKDQTDTLKDWKDPQIFKNESLGYHGAYGDGNYNGTHWTLKQSDSWSDPPRYYTLSEKPNAPYNDGATCKRLDDPGTVLCGEKGIKAPDPIPGTGEYTYYEYGMVDKPYDGFDYNLLKQNDKQYTDNFTFGTEDKKVSIYDANGNVVPNISVYDVKYHYLDPGLSGKTAYQEKSICFAEKNWPMSKEMGTYKGLFITNKAPGKNPKDTTIKCWNLPGQGGQKGDPENAATIENLKAGQSIFITEGQQGTGQMTGNKRTVGAFLLNSGGDLSLQTKQSYDGAPGTDGAATILTIGTQKFTANGGKGGAARQLLKAKYINVPVKECGVTRSGNSYPGNPVCAGLGTTTDPSVCTSHVECSAPCTLYEYCCWTVCTGHDEEGNCTSTKEECGRSSSHCACEQYTCQPRYYTVYEYDSANTNCKLAIRKEYFKKLNINACLYSSAVLESDLPTDNPKPINASGGYRMGDADFPIFNPEVKKYEVDSTDGNDLYYYTLDHADRERYEGEPGSGGYGAGELTKNYVKADDTGQSFAKFIGDDGVKGFAAIYKSSAYGGTGGQAGQYVSTMVKKLGKLIITVGHAGSPSEPNANGYAGGDTTVIENSTGKVLFVLKGGTPGQAKKLNIMADTANVSGGDGAASPVENESNRAKIIPLGGLSSNGLNHNSKMDGQTAAISTIWGKATMSGSSFQLPASASIQLNIVGGHPLDMTYGAGGGGGAGGPNGAGKGGAGTPGAVIIKW